MSLRYLPQGTINESEVWKCTLGVTAGDHNAAAAVATSAAVACARDGTIGDQYSYTALSINQSSGQHTSHRWNTAQPLCVNSAPLIVYTHHHKYPPHNTANTLCLSAQRARSR